MNNGQFVMEKGKLIRYNGNEKNIIIPDSVTTIGERAFLGCTSLTSVAIGDSVTEIGDYAFYGCTSLTSVTIGSGVKTIGESAFAGCASLESVVIPESVDKIERFAFANCTSLTNVEIPEGVGVIKEHAFLGCRVGRMVLGCKKVEKIGSKVERLVLRSTIKKFDMENTVGCKEVYCEPRTKPSGWKWSSSQTRAYYEALMRVSQIEICFYWGADIESV